MEQGMGFRLTKSLNLLSGFKSYFTLMMNVCNHKFIELQNLDDEMDGYNGTVRKYANDLVEFIEAYQKENREDLALLVKYLNYFIEEKDDEMLVANKTKFKDYYFFYKSKENDLIKLQNKFKAARNMNKTDEEYVLAVATNKFVLSCNLIMSEMKTISSRLERIIDSSEPKKKKK